MSSGPLAGVRVVQLASMAPAPFACMVLADLGAEVISVERVGETPTVPPGYFDRGHKKIAVNIKDPRGSAIVLDLIADADVLVEGFRPGVTERLGLGPDACGERNPRLVYARLTGYGQDGPLKDAAGHDINYIAMSGALSLFGHAGERPVPPANLLADFAGGGFLLVIGILAALQERATSGRGQVVDAAMVDGASLLATFIHAMGAAGLWHPERGKNLFDSGAALYDTYECADGKYVAVGALEPQFYAALLETLGLAEMDLPNPFDLDAAPVLRSAFASVFRTKTRDQWVEAFAGVDACVTPVLTLAEMPGDAFHRDRQTMVSVGGRLQPAPAPRFSRTPAGTPDMPASVDPGEFLGLADEVIDELRAEGVIA